MDRSDFERAMRDRTDEELAGRDPVFRDHNCYRCRDGTRPCVKGNPRSCDTLHARND